MARSVECVKDVTILVFGLHFCTAPIMIKIKIPSDFIEGWIRPEHFISLKQC